MDDNRELGRIGAVGILTEDDLPDIKTQRNRVLRLMKNGRWHSSLSIVATAGGSEGLRRMRELRSDTVTILKRRIPGRRVWEYQLVDHHATV